MDNINKKEYLGFLYVVLTKALTKRTKVAIGFLPLVAVISALFEVASVGMLVPFIQSLINPDFLKNIDIIQTIMISFKWSDSDMVFYVQVIFFLFIVISGLTRIFCNRMMLFTNARIGSEVSSYGVKKLFNMDYEDHTQLNSASAITTLTRKIDEVLDLTVTPILTLITGGITLSMIIVFLAWAAPEISAFIFITILITYAIVSYITSRMLKKHSKTQASGSVLVMTYLKEMIAGFRDIKLKNLNSQYVKNHLQADQLFRNSQASIRFYSQSPKFIVETVILLIAFVLALVLVSQDMLVNSAPTLIMIAIGLQKALPYAQIVYFSFSLLEGGKASGLDLIDFVNNHEVVDNLIPISPERSFDFQNIELSQVSFKYKISEEMILKDINFLIEVGDYIGVVGGSGSGKSTFSDLFLGLLEPTSGSILINGSELEADKLRIWQNMVAHVPQNLFIQNSSLAENIAFGIPKNLIDVPRVNEVLADVGLSEFVQTVPKGIWSSLGDDGGAISGGQRQRICLARALYNRQSEILVLDEPTSALNSELEDEIIELIFSLKRFKAILIVTHNRDILKYCNKTVNLDNKYRIAEA